MSDARFARLAVMCFQCRARVDDAGTFADGAALPRGWRLEPLREDSKAFVPTCPSCQTTTGGGS